MVKGIIRKIDDLGRIVLPKEMRKNLGMDAREQVDMYLEGDGIIYVKLYDSTAPRGITRPIDDLGRICLPKEYRKTLKINESDPVEMYIDGQVICVKPCKLQCVCCGSTDEDKLVEVKGVHMCPVCIEAFKEGVREGV